MPFFRTFCRISFCLSHLSIFLENQSEEELNILHQVVVPDTMLKSCRTNLISYNMIVTSHSSCRYLCSSFHRFTHGSKRHTNSQNESLIIFFKSWFIYVLVSFRFLCLSHLYNTKKKKILRLNFLSEASTNNKMEQK